MVKNKKQTHGGNKAVIDGNGHKQEPIPKKNLIKDDKPVAQKIPAFLTGGQMAGLISAKEMPSALNMLAQPGDSPKQLSMRTILGKKTEGTIMATSLAYTLGTDKEFKDKDDEEDVLTLMAMFVSDGGIGRIQLTEAITGERRHEEGKGVGGLMQRFLYGGNKGKDGQQ
jgi:hypothetical protein